MGPFCNVLVVENGGWNASPIEFLFTDHFKKACFLAGFRRFGVRQSLFADVEPCMRQPKLELTLRWLALGQLLGFKTGLLE